jgi:hypothetical protein
VVLSGPWSPVIELNQREITAIARPTSRMIARHIPLQKIIRRYTDPALLLGTLAAIVRKRRLLIKAILQGTARMPDEQRVTAADIAAVEKKIDFPIGAPGESVQTAQSVPVVQNVQNVQNAGEQRASGGEWWEPYVAEAPSAPRRAAANPDVFNKPVIPELSAAVAQLHAVPDVA